MKEMINNFFSGSFKNLVSMVIENNNIASKDLESILENMKT